ncbi:hypothetical protein [Halalkalicoccus jeotgali]|uniref:SWIM zinc finger domain protein n=1 Tax=Halalkalicoccus jeotgali (strain DSM 18796 / CECT 7217 / JCM 14584 / KCTC 4019 / B3) TaxID=795797 RepID=D8JBR4_HALJB|nr:hypothetical protein [Halalkalicoccus jeotgali]ADJ16717.1 SWIM zinc finger domain protein [Halalkalicoccus jeotgali B3]ELY40849.1 SWIM zinc finger domain-containing protein [Halalkalicoccus jeotgali B3]
MNVEEGFPVACECPSDTYHDGACNHRVAVAIREPVLKAASDYESGEEQEVATDGGTTVERSGSNEYCAKNRPTDCGCLPMFEDLPCWPCYRDGFRMPNPSMEATTED